MTPTVRRFAVYVLRPVEGGWLQDKRPIFTAAWFNAAKTFALGYRETMYLRSSVSLEWLTPNGWRCIERDLFIS